MLSGGVVCTLMLQVAVADEICLKNGDRISGRLVSLSASQCEFETPYQATLRVDRSSIVRLQTSEPVVVDLTSGERLVGIIVSPEDGILSTQSDVLGTLTFKLEQIARIAQPDKSLALASEPLDMRGKGTNSETGQAAPPQTAVATEPLGEKPEEDIRQFFLRQSAVLLKPGEMEFEVAFNYLRDEEQIFDIKLRERTFLFPLSLRVGLVNRAEGFVSLPVTYAHQELVHGEGAQRTDQFGIGDVAAGLKYQLIRESEEWPDVVASLGFSAPTGDDPYDHVVPTGNGHWSFSSGLTLIKSFDPAVLFGGIDYAHQFSRRFSIGAVQPGETIGYNFGLGFALNENLTLSGQLLGGFQTDWEVNGDSTASLSSEPIFLRWGLTHRLAKDKYLEPFVTFGLNDDARDAIVGISFVDRFR